MLNIAAENFAHILVARLVTYLSTRTRDWAPTHEELMEALAAPALAPAPAPKKAPAPAQVAPKKAPAKVSEPQPTQAEATQVVEPTQAEATQVVEPTQAEATQVVEPTQAEATQVVEPTQAEATQVVEPTPICKGTVLGKACTREAVKGKDLCKQCQVNHAKKEREAKKKDAPAAPAAPAAVAPPAAVAAPARALVVYDESKHLFRNLHTNWIVYDTDTESKVIGIAQGDDIAPLTATEREAALRAGYTVEEDPEATQVDPLLVPAPAPVPAPVPAPAHVKKTISRPRARPAPPPALPIPTSEMSEASTIPL